MMPLMGYLGQFPLKSPKFDTGFNSKYTAHMSSTYIKDAQGKLLATVYDSGSQVYLRDFKTARTLATYRKSSNTTLDLKTNTLVRGDQLLRFVR